MDDFYNKTVTIYNHTEGSLLGNEVWYPTVLTNVRVLESRSQNLSTNGTNESDSAKLFIKTDNLSKKYLEPIAWSDLEDKTGTFTLEQDKDFFVIGDTSTETTTIDNFFGYMKSKYDGVYRITSVAKYELIPHLEIGGR